MNFSTPLSRLRLIALIEGTSCVLLFFVAMPLKYLAGQDWAVTVVGSAHGALWVTYMLAVVNAWRARKWPADRVIVAGLVSIPPIATFIFDRSLRREHLATGDQLTDTAPAVESASLK